MKKTLLITRPIVSVYSNIANAQQILLNYKEGKRWVASHFLNYVVFEDDELGEIKPHFIPTSEIYLGGNYQMFSRNIFIPPLKYYNLCREMIKEAGGIVNLIRWAIDREYYVSFFVDRKYIRASGCDKSRIHETFVYGYDNDLKEVFLVDYFRKKELKEYRCSYDEINQAYLKAGDFYYAEDKEIPIVDVMLTKYITDYQYKENAEYIKNSISAYLSGSSIEGILDVRHTSFAPNATKHWGINSYEIFKKYIQLLVKEKKQTRFVTVHHCHHFLDHKKSLQFMFNELFSEKLEEKCSRDIDKLVKDAEILRNISLKFWFSKRLIDKSSEETMCRLLEEMKSIEQSVLQNMLDSIRKDQDEFSVKEEL